MLIIYKKDYTLLNTLVFNEWQISKFYINNFVFNITLMETSMHLRWFQSVKCLLMQFVLMIRSYMENWTAEPEGTHTSNVYSSQRAVAFLCKGFSPLCSENKSFSGVCKWCCALCFMDVLGKIFYYLNILKESKFFLKASWVR